MNKVGLLIIGLIANVINFPMIILRKEAKVVDFVRFIVCLGILAHAPWLLVLTQRLIITLGLRLFGVL